MKRAIIFGAVLCTSLGAALASGRPMAQAQGGVTKVTLNPVADTYVGRGIKEPQGKVRLRTGVRVSVPYNAYLRFDFPRTMGAGAKITSAKLRLFCIESVLDTDKTPDFQLSVVRQEWDQDTLIEKDAPQVEGPKFTWQLDACTETGVWKELVGSADMIEVVQRWFDGDKANYGWELAKKDPERAGLFGFESLETGGRFPLGNGPQLILEFMGGATITPTITPTDTPSNTPTPSDTPVPTETLTPSITPPPSDTPTPSNTPVPSDTPTITPTATSTPLPGDIFLPLVLTGHSMGSAAGAQLGRPVAFRAKPQGFGARERR